MAKYDYIKLRVSEDERAMLESMVEQKQASTLSDAARKLAFVEKAKSDTTETMTLYLQEISEIHQDLRKLVLAQIENRIIYEPDLMQMERKVAQLSKAAAKLSKAIRKGM